MREMDDDVAKNSIVAYDRQDVANAGSIDELEEDIRQYCNCTVEHMPHIGVFVLHWPNADHVNATEMLRFNGVVTAVEDMVVTAEPGEKEEEIPSVSKNH